MTRLKASLLIACGALATACAGQAASQTMNANSASYNAGYNRTAGQENRPVDVSLGDANGNVTVVNGLIQTTSTTSVFAHASGGAMDSVSGVGGGTATTTTSSGGSASAVGNSLTVVVQGDNNTVIVNSTQTNTGNVTATDSNGKP
jgi:holdfast attachment protein HfaA